MHPSSPPLHCPVLSPVLSYPALSYPQLPPLLPPILNSPLCTQLPPGFLFISSSSPPPLHMHPAPCNLDVSLEDLRMSR